MPSSDSLLRVVEDIEAGARKHGLGQQRDAGEFLDAVDLACARIYGRSLSEMMRHEQLRLVREIHRYVKGIADGGKDELHKRAMSVVLQRGRWNFQNTLDHLAELLLPAAPPPHEISAEIKEEKANA